MSTSDPLPEPPPPDPRENVTPDQPPWSAPAGAPTDRPRVDGDAFTDQPGGGAGDVPRYPDYDEDVTVAAPPPPPRKPHPHIGWAILWMLGFMIVTQGVGVVVTLLVIVIQVVFAPNRQQLRDQMNDAQTFTSSPEFAQMMWPGMLITELVTIACGWAALRFIAGPNWARKVALRLPSWPHLALVLLAVPAFILIGQGVDEIAKRYVRSLIDLDSAMAMIGYWPWWLGVLIIGFGPGIGEELFCRGFLGRGLVANHGVVLGVVFTSILFGVMHVEPRQMIYAPVMGIMLHLTYLWTRSLLMPMLIHTFNNSLGALAAWADKSHNTPAWLQAISEAGDRESFLWVYAGAVVLMIAVLIGLYISRARLVGADGGPPPWQPGYPGVEYPPPYSGTVVSRPLVPGLIALGIGLVGLLAFVAFCFRTYMLG
jgi:uncharacterized protein